MSISCIKCMQIKDKWYADNISLPIINSKI